MHIIPIKIKTYSTRTVYKQIIIPNMKDMIKGTWPYVSFLMAIG
jgi:hypothetical protein